MKEVICTFNISQELKFTINLPGFIQEKVLGEGSYGHVYKAKRLSDNNTYAIKVVDLSKLSRREIEDSVNEIRLMASFTSPFLIRFYEAFCEQKRLCIVTEYAKLGDLSTLIERRKRKRKPFPEMMIWRFLLQLLEGLRVLHSCGVVHRDLKSANVLLSAPDLIKIGDLGISTVLHQRQLAKTQIGTPIYLAPEVWKRKPYDQKCDMWSLGVLLYEMMTFSFPFNGRSENELVQRICLGRYSLPSNYSADLISILRRLLQVNPEQRPSVQDILNLKCVQDKMNMILPYLDKDVISNFKSPHLLSTIKVPLNMKNVNLPDPSYGKQQEGIKPIDQRMHLKKNIPMNPSDISRVSTPELKMIADQDWWSPNKIDSAPNSPRRSPDYKSIEKVMQHNKSPERASYERQRQANQPIPLRQQFVQQQPQRQIFRPFQYQYQQERMRQQPQFQPYQQPNPQLQMKQQPAFKQENQLNPQPQIRQQQQQQYQQPQQQLKQEQQIYQQQNKPQQPLYQQQQQQYKPQQPAYQQQHEPRPQYQNRYESEYAAPYPGFRQPYQYQRPDNQRPLFMQPKYPPPIPINQNNNMEYKPVYYDHTPRRDVKLPTGKDPRWNAKPAQKPSEQPPNNNFYNQPEWNEQQRKHPPVGINPRFKRIGIR